MTLYSFKKAIPIKALPERIRLSNGFTKTDSSTFTTDDLTDAGWIAVEDQPDFNESTHKLTWTGTESYCG